MHGQGAVVERAPIAPRVRFVEIGSPSGTPPEELRKSKALGDVFLLNALEVFEKRGKELGVGGKK